MSKKQLDENTIANELKGSSLFFQREAATSLPPTPSNDPASRVVDAVESPQERQRDTFPSSDVESPHNEPQSQNGPTRTRERSGDSNDVPPGARPSESIKTGMNTSTDASSNATMLARELALEADGDHAHLIETIRKRVKSVGKEVSYLRLTLPEKAELDEIVYMFKRQGVKTSENEINRIALNLMLADFKTNGQASLVARVIDALLA